MAEIYDGRLELDRGACGRTLASSLQRSCSCRQLPGKTRKVEVGCPEDTIPSHAHRTMTTASPLHQTREESRPAPSLPGLRLLFESQATFSVQPTEMRSVDSNLGKLTAPGAVRNFASMSPSSRWLRSGQKNSTTFTRRLKSAN